MSPKSSAKRLQDASTFLDTRSGGFASCSVSHACSVHAKVRRRRLRHTRWEAAEEFGGERWGK
eukprot:2130214-Pyramimonas_sp.AAC.1